VRERGMHTLAWINIFDKQERKKKKEKHDNVSCNDAKENNKIYTQIYMKKQL